MDLTPHPASPPAGRWQMRFSWAIAEHWLTLRWRVSGEGDLAIPRLAGRGRADGLWQATCFEIFVRDGEGPAYAEFNLSPSEHWAAYDFSDYRAAMRERDLPCEPVCTWRAGSAFSLFDAAIPLSGLPDLPAALAASAVLEEVGGTKSYWALAHPADQPDFHHADGFVLALDPPRDP
ncbi:DOMON-like domain-containing protein [Erythrobacter sp. QSSC1-22B]|uniref:DOMON-like domain-containing protein n=1 Tax=Erythrobacter sp. QSSC1-22B TaxID=1860125 RepID=UPI0035189CAF